MGWEHVILQNSKRGMKFMKRRILLFEDEEAIRDALAERLMVEGFEVGTAPDGRKGLNLFQETSGELVITDILMPDLDGLEVIRTLKKLKVSPLIIAMSGGGGRDLDFLIEAKEFGADGVLAKPFHADELVVMVQKLLFANLTPCQSG